MCVCGGVNGGKSALVNMDRVVLDNFITITPLHYKNKSDQAKLDLFIIGYTSALIFLTITILIVLD